jgi:hypothetical protein
MPGNPAFQGIAAGPVGNNADMFHPSAMSTMSTPNPHMLSQQELAKRWGRSVSAIGLCSAVGLGPRYVKEDGALRYPVAEVQKYERARLML